MKKVFIYRNSTMLVAIDVERFMEDMDYHLTVAREFHEARWSSSARKKEVAWKVTMNLLNMIIDGHLANGNTTFYI